MKLLRSNIAIILIIVLASFLRLLWVDKIPNAIGGDELTYIINAKSLYLIGTDISGTWNPLSGFLFQYPSYTTPQAELPYFLQAPVVGATSFSLFSARITFVILSILTVLFIYLISRQLFGKEVGLISGIVAALNPWLIYIGRTSYEASPAVFFFLVAFYILLVAKGKRILWSIPFLYFAFYSYVGTKLSFLPFVVVTLLYSYFVVSKKKYLKEYLIVFAASFALLFIFLLSMVFKTGSSPSRIGEVLLPNNPEIQKQVDEIRKVSIQNPFTNVFENKITIYLRILITRFFKSISADYLFISGDNFYSIIRNGMFYIVDIVFILFGLVSAYSTKRKAFWLLTLITSIAILPQVFQGIDLRDFVFHLSLMFPFLIILIAVGIWEIVNLFKDKRYFYGSSALIIVLYGFLVFNFLNIYFYQWPLRGNFDFHVRVFSKYITVAKSQNRQIDIYSPSASDIFKKYIFYTNSYNKSTYLNIRKIYKSNKFSFQNLNFKGCNNTLDPTKSKNIIIYDANCGNLKKPYNHLSIARLDDGGDRYLIFNDTVCTNFDLKLYPQNIKISDFAIEQMQNKNFCEKYITRP